MKSWNVVLNKFIEIKEKYIQEFGKVNYEYSDKTCIENWVKELNIKEYQILLSPLQFVQYENLLLIRYANYSNVFSGESEDTFQFKFENFWNLYDGFYRECRSIVIDIKNDKLVLVPFKKFMNLNENEETSIENIQNKIKNAKTIEFSDKLDGSMQSATYYKGKIIMSGSQSLDVNNSWRLEDGYRMLNENDNYIDMIIEHPNLTFIFEYISIKDAHVVNYNKEQEGLYLIGIRNNINGEEASYDKVTLMADIYFVKTTTIFNKTLEQVVNELEDKKSNEAEGFVLNIDGYKVKIKYSDYCNMHKILSNISSVNLIIKNIADNTFDDMVSKIPKAYRERVLKTSEKIYRYIKIMDDNVKRYLCEAPQGSTRDFMIYVDKNVPIEFKGYCRSLYLGKEVNYLKGGNEKCPNYKKMNFIEEMLNVLGYVFIHDCFGNIKGHWKITKGDEYE